MTGGASVRAAVAPLRRLGRRLHRRFARGARAATCEVGRLELDEVEAWLRVIRARGPVSAPAELRYRHVAAGRAPGAIGAAWRGPRIVGSVLVDGGDPPTIWDLWVRPLARSRGVGRALVAWAVREAGGGRSLRAHVRPGSDAWRIFRDAGFRVRPRLEGVTPRHVVVALNYPRATEDG